MAEQKPESEPGGLQEYFAGWWSYLRGPKSFLSAQDLSGRKTTSRSVKVLGAGVAAVVALSAFNLKFSPDMATPANKELFAGRTVTTGLLLGSLAMAVAAHLAAKALQGAGGWRQTCVAFFFTLGYLWPVSAAVLILIAWFMRLATGLPYTALPPFDVPVGGVLERTFWNIAAVAAAVTAMLWLVGFLLYCYACAIRVAHGLGWVRAVVAIAIAVAVLNIPPIARAIVWAAEKFEPLISWFAARF